MQTKTIILDSLNKAVARLRQASKIPESVGVDIQLERCKDKQHGDYATNLALMLAKPCRCNPRELAQQIVEALPEHEGIQKVEIAGPGFINFHLSETSFFAVLPAILEKKSQYGQGQQGQGERIHLEFVSANPTGPLHVGHGRGAAYGSAVATLLRALGYEVHAEYYVNDAGRQMDILAVSVWLRYLQQAGIEIAFLNNGYQGEYVVEIAQELLEKYGQQFAHPAEAVLQDLPVDASDDKDKETYTDALITRAKQLLGAEHFQVIHQYGLEVILDGIGNDLKDFGVEFQNWFSERTLYQKNNGNDRVSHFISELTQQGHTYEREGAQWFNATAFGDEKDRVLKRANGQYTYFAADIAYHFDKVQRGYDHYIDVFGADHHGYVPRVKAAMKALTQSEEKLNVILVQFAILWRGEVRVPMSTRKGQYVTLRDLYQEVGIDATRYFYLSRKVSNHLDFDLEVAKSRSMDNPVYYIQYAHARSHSVQQQLAARNLTWDKAAGIKALSRLDTEHERDLIACLARYPEIVLSAALNYEPPQLAYYLRELANFFHVYYNAHQFIVDDTGLRDARFCLIVAVQQVLCNGLSLLGISAPEKM